MSIKYAQGFLLEAELLFNLVLIEDYCILMTPEVSFKMLKWNIPCLWYLFGVFFWGDKQALLRRKSVFHVVNRISL